MERKGEREEEEREKGKERDKRGEWAEVEQSGRSVVGCRWASGFEMDE